MNHIYCWLTNSLTRVYKQTPPEAGNYTAVNLARNDRGSFQVCLRNQEQEVVNVRIVADYSDKIGIKIRRVGHVPLPHFNTGTDDNELAGQGFIPGYVPDPLFNQMQMELAPVETNSYWITITTDKDTPPGSYLVKLRIIVEEETIANLSAEVKVYNQVLQGRDDFPVTHWFYADALCDWYQVQPFTGKFWGIARSYIKNLVTHGTNVMHSPLFTPPTDGVKRPHQLLKIRVEEEDNKRTYGFDWSHVRKWVKLAQDCGMKYFEWPHLFSQWGIEKAIRIYENYDGQYEGRLLWPPDTAAASSIYRDFLAQFLPEFKKFLEDEGIFANSFFHLSDEPHGKEHLQNYRRARNILQELAPWMKVMDALSEVDFAREGLTDMPIASIKSSEEFCKAGIPHWDYFCCGPRGPYLNRLLDTPLAKIRGTGWLLYNLEARGFLHWGFNYWYQSQTRNMINPFFETDGLAWPNWAYGDPFVVYPGEEGPIDSIRWEIFAESLKDYELLSVLELGELNDKRASVLAPFKSYQDYPKSADWYLMNRSSMLQEIK